MLIFDPKYIFPIPPAEFIIPGEDPLTTLHKEAMLCQLAGTYYNAPFDTNFIAWAALTALYQPVHKTLIFKLFPNLVSQGRYVRYIQPALLNRFPPVFEVHSKFFSIDNPLLTNVAFENYLFLIFDQLVSESHRTESDFIELQQKRSISGSLVKLKKNSKFRSPYIFVLNQKDSICLTLGTSNETVYAPHFTPSKDLTNRIHTCTSIVDLTKTLFNLHLSVASKFNKYYLSRLLKSTPEQILESLMAILATLPDPQNLISSGTYYFVVNKYNIPFLLIDLEKTHVIYKSLLISPIGLTQVTDSNSFIPQNLSDTTVLKKLDQSTHFKSYFHSMYRTKSDALAELNLTVLKELTGM